MELSFSPALPADAEVIYHFARELIERYEDPAAVDLDRALVWTHRKIEIHIRQYICVLCDGEKAGYFRFVPRENGMELDDLYVLPAFRGLGIGTAVVNRCIGYGKPVELYVFMKNTGALRFYHRLGFEMIRQVSPTRGILRREVL